MSRRAPNHGVFMFIVKERFRIFVFGRARWGRWRSLAYHDFQEQAEARWRELVKSNPITKDRELAIFHKGKRL